MIRCCIPSPGRRRGWFPGNVASKAKFAKSELALEQNGRTDAVEFIRWRWRNGLSLTNAAEALGLSRRQV
jgi:hypothetical protein